MLSIGVSMHTAGRMHSIGHSFVILCNFPVPQLIAVNLATNS